ncbi:unnamed protein product [Amoebophrya sp. A25]|nr:unnamed protein product [Amoebophrya sp. A25]|eukprot:GSA25T00025247001.1
MIASAPCLPSSALSPGSMAGAEDFLVFFAELAESAPEDANAILEAQKKLEKQRIRSLDRLARLTDAQWQRIDVEIGVEGLIRSTLEELLASTACAKSPASSRGGGGGARPTLLQENGDASDEQSSELRHRGRKISAENNPEDDVQNKRGSARRAYGMMLNSGEHEARTLTDHAPSRKYNHGSNKKDEELINVEYNDQVDGDEDDDPDLGSTADVSASTSSGPTPEINLEPPENLEELWENLLVETLPPEKRETLWRQWDETPTREDKFMMLLEYNSYLRRPEISEEERAERRRQLEPLLAKYGMLDKDEDSLLSGTFSGEGNWALGQKNYRFPWVALAVFATFACSVYYLLFHLDDGNYASKIDRGQPHLLSDFSFGGALHEEQL